MWSRAIVQGTGGDRSARLVEGALDSVRGADIRWLLPGSSSMVLAAGWEVCPVPYTANVCLLVWTVVYLWRGERHRTYCASEAEARRVAYDMRADGWQAWAERIA